LRTRALRLVGTIAALALAGTVAATVTAAVERSTGKTMTEQRAVDRVNDHLKKVTSGVGLPMRLETQSKQKTACGDTAGRTRRERVEQRFWVRDIGIPNPDVFGAFRRFWPAHGYVVIKDDVAGSGILSVRSSSDGYELSLAQDKSGALLLSVTSPCTVEQKE
jgi:hypothetical protein